MTLAAPAVVIVTCSGCKMPPIPRQPYATRLDVIRWQAVADAHEADHPGHRVSLWDSPTSQLPRPTRKD